MANNWIYVDERDRVLGGNPNNMSGNTGWHGIAGVLPEPLLSPEGAPLYQRTGDAVVPRSPAEVAADISPPQAGPTEAERLEALEAAVLEMILEGGL